MGHLLPSASDFDLGQTERGAVITRCDDETTARLERVGQLFEEGANG